MMDMNTQNQIYALEATVASTRSDLMSMIGEDVNAAPEEREQERAALRLLEKLFDAKLELALLRALSHVR